MTEPVSGLLRVIGAGLDNASARLEKLSHAKWTMQTVSVRQFEPVEFSAFFSADRSEGFGVIFTAGETSFVLFLLASSATAICRAYLGSAYQAATERDAVAEISNIVVNSMADEIGEATEEILLLTAPRVVEGLRCDILKRALESFRAEGRPCPIVSQVYMTAENLSAECMFLLLMPSSVRARF